MSQQSTDSTEFFIPDPFPGEFRLVRELGQGTFGTVWLAEDLTPLHRQVALKFVRIRLSRRFDAVEALHREARMLASLHHPNIVPVYTWKEPSNPETPPCLVLRFISGGSLESVVKRDGPLPWHVATRYVADIADGLLALHGRDIVHRDVKPANMLLDPVTDEALLTDLGVAVRLSDPATVGGTLPYMAPEAFDGVISPALDVYGLAASLFWLVTGQRVFDADDRIALIGAIASGLPGVDPRFAGLPRPVEELIRAGLTPDHAARPALSEFAALLRGNLNLLLADRLGETPGAKPSGGLRLLVSLREPDGTVRPVASSVPPPETIFRDMRRVPAEPQRVTLQTGDRVRIEVVSDRPGYVVVFNIGPTGRLNLLHPASLHAPQQPLRAGQTLPIVEVEMTPPAGRERLVAVWTSTPLPLRLDELRSLDPTQPPAVSPQYLATRDMARVGESLTRVAGERQTVVLELDHQGNTGEWMT